MFDVKYFEFCLKRHWSSKDGDLIDRFTRPMEEVN